MGQACASSMPPAPLLCTPPHKLKHTHSLAFSLGLSLLNTGALSPPCLPPPPVCVCLSPSLKHSSSVCLSHTLACYSSSSAQCEDDCLWTDIYDTGRMCWINSFCIGIAPINKQKRNYCFIIIIQKENELFCHELFDEARNKMS